MQRKLIGLGLGSLGTITGLNFILKGENDDLSNKWIENREEDLNNNPAFEAPLPESVIKELKEEQEAQRKKKELKEWREREARRVEQINATTRNGINTGALRKFLIKLLKDDSYSTKVISRDSLDGMFSSLSRKGYPTFFKNNQVNWEVIKQEVEKHNVTLQVNK